MADKITLMLRESVNDGSVSPNRSVPAMELVDEYKVNIIVGQNKYPIDLSLRDRFHAASPTDPARAKLLYDSNGKEDDGGECIPTTIPIFLGDDPPTDGEVFNFHQSTSSPFSQNFHNASDKSATWDEQQHPTSGSLIDMSQASNNFTCQELVTNGMPIYRHEQTWNDDTEADEKRRNKHHLLRELLRTRKVPNQVQNSNGAIQNGGHDSNKGLMLISLVNYQNFIFLFYFYFIYLFYFFILKTVLIVSLFCIHVGFNLSSTANEQLPISTGSVEVPNMSSYLLKYVVTFV